MTEHIVDFYEELTSCLVSSTLFPTASLAAVARSPSPALLSLATSSQVVNWRLYTWARGSHAFVALFLGLSCGTLKALEALLDGIPNRQVVQ